MSSRIALMSDGVLQQCAAPEQIYDRPGNLFAASFIGSPKMNLVSARLGGDAGAPAIEWLGMRTPLAGEQAKALKRLGRGAELVVGIRPEDLRWADDAPASHNVQVAATVDVVEPLGPETFVVSRVGDHALTARFPPRSGIGPGAEVRLALHPAHLHLFDAHTEQNVLTGEGTHVQSRQSPVDDEAALASERS
jgi:multiple sugar transport system ATP-binding protein